MLTIFQGPTGSIFFLAMLYNQQHSILKFLFFFSLLRIETGPYTCSTTNPHFQALTGEF